MLLAVRWSVSTGDFPGLQNVFLASAKTNGSRCWTRVTGKSQAGWLPTAQSSLDRGLSGSCECERTQPCASGAGSAAGWLRAQAAHGCSLSQQAWGRASTAVRTLLPVLGLCTEVSLVWRCYACRRMSTFVFQWRGLSGSKVARQKQAMSS